MPTGDYYGGARPGNNLFSDSLVCLDARTGKRVWYFQLVHHDIWDMDITAAPMLVDINAQVNGSVRRIKAVAVVSKQGFTYVFDRVTGVPAWPIVERPVPQSDVPGEKTSATQPFPTKPPAFDRQGTSLDDLIDFTPAIKAEAILIASQYKLGPLFTPLIVATPEKKGTLLLPSHIGGANWQGGSIDPETGMLYVASVTNADPMALALADPKRSNIGYVSAGTAATSPTSKPGISAPVPAVNDNIPRAAPKFNIGPGGLPLAKPPWGRIVAIDLNKGDIAWTIANSDTPDYVRNHPLLKGIDVGRTGKPSRSPLMVTKTLLFSADGNDLFNGLTGGGGNVFRAIDKKTGAVLHEMQLPAMATGIPMTYMVDGRQFIVVAVGATGVPAQLVALALP
jgi:quinoprotein glucose dehydrogenase